MNCGHTAEDHAAIIRDLTSDTLKPAELAAVHWTAGILAEARAELEEL